MLMDKEKNRIQLSSKPNGHLLCWENLGWGRLFIYVVRVEERSRKRPFYNAIRLFRRATVIKN